MLLVLEMRFLIDWVYNRGVGGGARFFQNVRNY